jgi:hypothetical protein
MDDLCQIQWSIFSGNGGPFTPDYASVKDVQWWSDPDYGDQIRKRWATSFWGYRTEEEKRQEGTNGSGCRQDVSLLVAYFTLQATKPAWS